MINSSSYFIEIEKMEVNRLYRQFVKSHGNKIKFYDYDCKILIINLTVLYVSTIERIFHLTPVFWCHNSIFYIEIFNDPTDLYNIGLISDFLNLNLNPKNQIKKKKYLRICNCM